MFGHKGADGLRVGKPGEDAGQILPAGEGEHGSRNDEHGDHAAAQGAAALVEPALLGLVHGGCAHGDRDTGFLLRDRRSMPELTQGMRVHAARRTSAGNLTGKAFALGLHSHHRDPSSPSYRDSFAAGCLSFVYRR